MKFEQIIYEIEDGVALVTLNRPERMNAYTPLMGKELIEVFTQADQDDSVRVVVVTGAGKAFCAGMDLAGGGETFDYTKRSDGTDDETKHRDAGGRMSLAIFDCRKPVIAAINGAAVGVAMTLVTAMDMRVASEDAKVGYVFSRRGVVPEACSPWFLPRIVGRAKAAELFYTGRVFLAREEANSGLFNYVTQPGQALAKAMELAREIVDNTSGVSVALCKALLRHGMMQTDPMAEHLMESRVFHWAGRQADCAEGIESFLEKRPPDFKMSPTKDMPDFYPWWKQSDD